MRGGVKKPISRFRYFPNRTKWSSIWFHQQIWQVSPQLSYGDTCQHDDVIKWNHFPRYWPFVWGIHRSTVNFPHKGQWRGALMFSLICAWINAWVNNGDAGDLTRYRAHYDVTAMKNERDLKNVTYACRNIRNIINDEIDEAIVTPPQIIWGRRFV